MHPWLKRVRSLMLAGAVVLAAAAAAPAEGWGTIKGKVVWGEKNIPAPIKLDVNGNDKAVCLAKGPILKEEFVINPKNKGVRWAAVYLMSTKGFPAAIPIHPKLRAVKKAPVEVDQPCCRFEPHVVMLREGQTLVVKNSAAIPHNTKIDGSSLGPNINPILPPGKSLKVEDIKARPLPISMSCSIHGWMTCKIFVLKHPYFAVTDADGKFEIKDAPAGDYRLFIWQEGMGYVAGDKEPSKKGKKITIKADAVTDLGQFLVKP